MSLRDRIIAAAAVSGLHLVVLGLTVGDSSVIVDPIFRPEAEAILDGSLPYSDRDFEYPPLALPLLLGPALISSSEAAYRAAFQWEMIGFDLAIVLLLALALRGSGARICSALGVYSVGVIALSGIGPLPNSDIDEAPLALARFDLAPGALVLAAAIARQAARSATWSALLSAGVAVKAFPLLLYPNFLFGERHPRRVALAALGPLAAAAAIVLVTGDEFFSAISYHTGRELQVETLGATPLMLAHLLGAGAATETGGGAYNLVADGADVARALSVGVLAGAYVFLLWEGWRRRTPALEMATAILAAAVVFAPVLSPQFLLWVLPASAAAYGLRLPNLLLLVAVGLTQVMLSLYGGVETLSTGFVLAVAARNAVLIAYLASVVAAIAVPRRPMPDRAAPQAPRRDAVRARA
jgi:hypothetical protein